MKIKTTLLLSLFSTLTFAQSPQMLWESFFDGSLTGKDVANSVIIDDAGDIFLTGRSYQTATGGNFTTLKLNGSDGIMQWVDHYSGTSTNGTNRGIKLVADNFENIYAIGTVSSNQGDIAIAKYNSSGVVWAKSYEPYWFGSDKDFGVDMAIDSIGNIYTVGQTTSLSGQLYDMYVMKCDSGGTKIYEDIYSSASGDDYPGGIAVTPAGNVFALTSSFNFFGTATYDITTINYLSDGLHNWFSSYDGSGNDDDYGTFIKADALNNQYVCGTSDEGASNDMVVMKQNLYGTRLWTTKYNGTANLNDTAISTTWLPNGFVAVTGRSRELVNGNTIVAFVTMVIDSGTVVWTDKFYGSENGGASPSQMVTDEQGNIYICGFETMTNGTKNGVIIKYDINGNLLWNISYDNGVALDDKFNSITLGNNNSIIVSGQSFTATTSSNYVTVKYQDVATEVNELAASFEDQILLYPNPVKAGTVLHINSMIPNSTSQFSIYDLAGHEIETGNLYSSTLKLSNKITSGNYLFKLTTNGMSVYRKIVVTE